VPDVSDTNYMIQILSALGADVERSSGTVRITCEEISDAAPYELVRRMRASICVMGPLLARMGRAVVSLPGGCVIGDRPVDLHLRGLEGARREGRVRRRKHHPQLTAKDGLRGAEIDLRGTHGPTVLGTDNVMMAATLAEGITVIESAAAEPEVLDLADFLNAMGAKITGAGTRRIVIEGVKELTAVEHTVIPDRIEAGTFMAAAALAGEGVTLRRSAAITSRRSPRRSNNPATASSSTKREIPARFSAAARFRESISSPLPIPATRPTCRRR
jgi:UDP-N-acetylglucosamine 1-carboxyvinyltransferase